MSSAVALSLSILFQPTETGYLQISPAMCLSIFTILALASQDLFTLLHMTPAMWDGKK